MLHKIPRKLSVDIITNVSRIELQFSLSMSSLRIMCLMHQQMRNEKQDSYSKESEENLYKKVNDRAVGFVCSTCRELTRYGGRNTV